MADFDPDDPVRNLDGVIADIKGRDVNDVDVKTLERVQAQILEMRASLRQARADEAR